MLDPRIRRRARERAMQFLFGLDFTGYDWRGALTAFWEANPSRPAVKKYAHQVIQGVCMDRQALDAAITSVLHHWSPGRVARVEWAILRIALYEMEHMADVPAKVAINEAVEIAKRYGPEEAPRFVNGVLDRLREAGSLKDGPGSA